MSVTVYLDQEQRMTLHHPEHGEHCMCTGCHTARVQAHARERILREQVSASVPERDVHWTWLHGPTPPGTVLSPREAFEQRTGCRITKGGGDGMTWTRSSACSMGTCVEVRHLDGHVEVRDNTTPDTVLHITPADWAAFLVGAKAGEFDGPAADTGPAREHRAQETEARDVLAGKLLDHLIDVEPATPDGGVAPDGAMAVRLVNLVLSAGWQLPADTTPDPS